jgi:hypothetical protein
MDRMNQWLSVLANVGVLIGVFVVAYELRQNTIAMEASSRQEFAAQDIAYLSTALDTSIVAVALNKIERSEPLTDLELSQIVNRQHMNFRIFENAFYQYQKGALEPQEWRRYVQIIDYLFCDDQPQRAKDMWEQFRPGFVTGFVRVVDQINAECPE